MNLEESAALAAKAANDAVWATLGKYRHGGVVDEDDITPDLLARIDDRLNGAIGDLHWTSKVMRHRAGTAAEEAVTGADILIHVSFSTTEVSYSKGVLIQAKRIEPRVLMRKESHQELQDQCSKMLHITPASFVFTYSKNEIRCGSASRIAGETRRDLVGNCSWTSYRFFLELFRCPIGDPRITSAVFRDLPVPYKLSISATNIDVRPDLG